MAQVKNYSEKDVSMMIGVYTANPTRETVETLAEKLSKKQEALLLSFQKKGVYKATKSHKSRRTCSAQKRVCR